MAKKKPDKLAQEVSMAIAAGMSYGKWKAMQGCTEPTEKPGRHRQETQNSRPRIMQLILNVRLRFIGPPTF
jgi:hypothetical protein